MTTQLTLKPYRCLACEASLSGADPRLSAHLDFRLHKAELKRAFDPRLQWMRDAAYRLAPLQYIVKRKSFMVADTTIQWCNPEVLVRAVALKLLPFPCDNVGGSNAAVTILSWNVQMRTEDAAPGLTGNRPWRRRVRTPTAVYRATIRSFQRWLFGGPAAVLKREAELRAIWRQAEDDNGIDAMALPAQELAYVFMMNSLTSFSSLGQALGDLELMDEPIIGLRTCEGRLPRIAYRAIYLAVFAGYYWAIRRARRYGRVRLQNLASLPMNHLVAVFDLPQEITSLSSGGVFFPTVPGMPIRPF
ncbi:hypothetical protein [Massilia horti]|uniref:Uncharacterized protein n=1 Tax=Massilia horti TaxID=2562153 RepID=A0A4Y9SYP8_9BURK|nr:hypothetical protein [Massilia horti]TFW31778.1 hypothetical protein E4O92_12585 [Massilia horti]